MSTRLHLPPRWSDWLLEQGETGMSYQIVTVRLRDGRIFTKLPVIGSTLLCPRDGDPDLPFSVDDIESIELTHDKSK